MRLPTKKSSIAIRRSTRAVTSATSVVCRSSVILRTDASNRFRSHCPHSVPLFYGRCTSEANGPRAGSPRATVSARRHVGRERRQFRALFGKRREGGAVHL